MPYSQSILDLGAAVNNWGRWGDDDRIGTLNFITDAAVAEAASSIRSGRRFSLAYPLSADGLQVGFIPGRVNADRTMIQIHEQMLGESAMFTTNDDVVTMGLQAGTHWDGLCHASYRDTFYNGVPTDSLTEEGAGVLGIENIKTLTGRGVLLDIARLHDVEVLELGYAITADDLQKAEAVQGVEVRSGDIVLIRTGMMTHPLAGDVAAYYGSLDDTGMPMAPGVSPLAASFFHEREVAAVATDNITFEVLPWDPTLPGEMFPVHCIHLVDMGLTQGQNFVLEELAADCAADGQWDFFLEASPQPFVGGVGSPVNPVAIK